ncbi:MAG: hypothetical protein K2X55_09145 [Burkholderiaceae bacterium]|nr:hypothetical protein [Burkholderiaceae bacterium]
MTIITKQLNFFKKIANISLIIKTAGHYLGRSRALQGLAPSGGPSPQIQGTLVFFDGKIANFSGLFDPQAQSTAHHAGRLKILVSKCKCQQRHLL